MHEQQAQTFQLLLEQQISAVQLLTEEKIKRYARWFDFDEAIGSGYTSRDVEQEADYIRYKEATGLADAVKKNIAHLKDWFGRTQCDGISINESAQDLLDELYPQVNLTKINPSNEVGKNNIYLSAVRFAQFLSAVSTINANAILSCLQERYDPHAQIELKEKQTKNEISWAFEQRQNDIKVPFDASKYFPSRASFDVARSILTLANYLEFLLKRNLVRSAQRDATLAMASILKQYGYALWNRHHEIVDGETLEAQDAGIKLKSYKKHLTIKYPKVLQPLLDRVIGN